MLRRSSLPALLALTGMLSPWAGVAVLSAHLLSDHHQDAAVPDASNLAAILHGHEHLERSPAHEHSFLPAATSAHRLRFARGVSTPAPPVTAYEPGFAGAPADPARDESRRGVAHGPPAHAARKPVLRI